MHRFSKFEVLNWLELSRKQIGTSKSVLEYIFWLLLITALVIWVNLSWNRFLQVGFFFFMEMKNGWSKKFIIWVILRHGNGSRMKFYLTPICHTKSELDQFMYNRKIRTFKTGFSVQNNLLKLCSIALWIHKGFCAVKKLCEIIILK